MRIAHLSDLHFGRHDTRIADALLGDIRKQSPDLIVVSGDFTQVGSRREFEEARTFLDQLPCSLFAVPGNHDVPAFDITTRLLNPYGRYREFIAEDLEPTMIVGTVMLAGIKTSRRMRLGLNWANGSISETQLRSVAQRISSAPAGVVPVVVAHHPLLHPQQSLEKPMRLVKRADDALSAFAKLGVRLILSGHFHRSYRRDHMVATAAEISDGSARTPMIVLQAASAISNRLRGDLNGYNVIDIDHGSIVISVREWDGNAWGDNPAVNARVVSSP